MGYRLPIGFSGSGNDPRILDPGSGNVITAAERAALAAFGPTTDWVRSQANSIRSSLSATSLSLTVDAPGTEHALVFQRGRGATYYLVDREAPADLQRFYLHNRNGITYLRWTNDAGDVVLPGSILLYSGGGMLFTGAAGGQQGPGTINAPAFYENGVALSAKYALTSDALSKSQGGVLTGNLHLLRSAADPAVVRLEGDNAWLRMADLNAPVNRRAYQQVVANGALLIQSSVDDYTSAETLMWFRHGGGISVGVPTGGPPATRGELNAVALREQGTLLSSKYAPVAHTHATVAANSVGQAGLKTVTGVVALAAGDAGVLPGGQYGFFPLTRPDTGAGPSLLALGSMTPPGTSQAIVEADVTSTGGVHITQRYVSASPPYDLGDGDVQGFVFAGITPDGVLASLYLAHDPPWAYNGPTDIRPDHQDEQGRSWRYVYESADQDPRTRAHRLRTPTAAMLLTPEHKNADMPAIPQPFSRLVGQTVVLLDPMSEVVRDLMVLNEHDEAVDALRSGHVVISNSSSNRAGPPGVGVASARWKNTRS